MLSEGSQYLTHLESSFCRNRAIDVAKYFKVHDHRFNTLDINMDAARCLKIRNHDDRSKHVKIAEAVPCSKLGATTSVRSETCQFAQPFVVRRKLPEIQNFQVEA